MKNLFKNKLFIGALVLLLAIIIALVVFLLPINKKEDKNEIKKEIHTMYVKINPLVKLTFEVSYEECIDKDGLVYVCRTFNENVVDSELINDDAKDIYNDLDFKEKNLYDVLAEICTTARDNKIGFHSLDITSDYEFKENEIAEKLKDKLSITETFTVNVDFKEHIDSGDVEKIDKESTLDKINLNDDILVRVYGEYWTNMCSSIDGYVFSDNITEVLADYREKNSFHKYAKYPFLNENDYKDYETYRKVLEKAVKEWDNEWKNKYKKIVFDEVKEKEAYNSMKAILDKAYGVRKAGVSLENHLINYGFEYLHIDNAKDLGNFGASFNNYYAELEKNLYSKLDGAYFVYEGGCGDYNDETLLLNEKLCKKYGLTCSRW